ncbi:MAG: YkgJ family cysteine cluster protein [Gammaproteobacteria bacterium]|nr:YkgJ family cysteine cluster protein [Gammaproteobacteria bacterium]
MSEREIDWDEEFADDPEWQAMTPQQREKLLTFMEKTLEKGLAAIYGDEEENEPDANVDCEQCIPYCKARCCTLIFALTREEVGKGIARFNQKRPYFIARDEDGYCPHLERQNYHCEIWQERPLRCRRYDCRNDENIWPDGIPEILSSAFPDKSE